MGIHRAGWILLGLGLAACGGAAQGPVAPGAASADRGDKAGNVAEQAAANPASSAAVEAPAAPSTAEKAASPAASPSDPGAKDQPVEVTALADLAASPGASDLEAGAQAVQKEDWIGAQKKLGGAVERRAKAGDRPDVIMAGYALLGRSYAKGGAAPQAEAAYRKVLTIWNEPATAEAMKGTVGDAASHDRRDRAVLAVAEAMFFVAEQMRGAADKLRMPEYHGKSDRESVSAFVKADIAAFIQRKQPILDEVDAAYRHILDLQPVPPRWAFDAFASMAMMRGKHVAELRAAPIPQAWRHAGKDPATGEGYPEIRSFYYKSLDEISAPLRTRARSAFETCAQSAKRLSIDDAQARRCTVWLEKNAG